MSLERFARPSGSIQRVPGTAVLLSPTQEGVPPALLHSVKHNKVLHERVIVAPVVVAKVPHVAAEDRLFISPVGDDLHPVRINYDFMDEVDVPAALAGRTPGSRR